MIADLIERLRALLFRGRWERDLAEELDFHLQEEASARQASGASAEAALRDARLALGGVEQQKEAIRDASGIRPLDDLGRDVRFAGRALRRNPGFALTVVLVLGLGIGAGAAVFAVVQAVLLAQLPYPGGDRLVRVFQQNSVTNRWSLSVVDVQAIRDQNQSFVAFGAAQASSAALSGLGTAEEIPVARVSAGFFTALSVTPAAGRLITPADEPPGAPPVVLVTHAFAQRLGGTAAAVGRSLSLDGVSHTVVGVLAPGVDELAGMRAPVFPVLQLAPPTRRGPFGLRGIGLLRDGVTIDRAAEDLAGISRRIFPLWQAGFRDSVARLVPFSLRETIVSRSREELWLFAGAVALMLVVAVVNVATLALVRAAAREHELTVRAALGASRFRLGRLVIVECLVLTLSASLIGLGLAWAGLRFFVRLVPDLPRVHEITMDGRVAAVGLALGILSGLAVSIAPIAAVLTRRHVRMPGDARRGGEGRNRGRVRGLLIAAEFALAVPLLLAAGLLGRSLIHLVGVDPGYDSRSTFAVPITLPRARYSSPEQVLGFWHQALDQIQAEPGVLAAGVADASPPDNQGASNNFNLVSHPVPPGGAEPVSPWSAVTPGYFEALRIPLVAGRMFAPTDTAAAPPVALVSRAWAERYLPGEDPVGQQLIEGGCYGCPLTTIVGVVGDVKYQGLAGDGDGVYIPLTQAAATRATIFVRTQGSPTDLIRPVLGRIEALDPELPLTAETLSDQLNRAFLDPGRWTAVLAAFATVALALSALGIFGLLSYVVRRDRREIGVRLALGAEPGTVTWMLVRRGMGYVAAGLAGGLLIAAAGAGWVRPLLFEVTPADPTTLAAVLLLLVSAGFGASLIPALRAARIRPSEALSEE